MSYLCRTFTFISLAGIVVAIVPISALAQQQSVKQRLCIRQMNKAGEVVAQTQGQLHRKCVKLSGNESGADVDACIVASSVRVGRKKQSTIRRENSRCLRSPEQNPDFGKTDATTVNNAAVGEEINLFASVMGSPADTGIIDCDISRDGCKCQQKVVQYFEKLMNRKLEGFRLCKKPGLRHGTIISNAGLENCMGADPNGKVAARLARLQDIIQKRCIDDGIDLGTAFPGSCTAAPDLTACLDVRTNCYTCRMLNAEDGLSKDCDLYDDGVANASCPA